ncbi:Cyclic AMP receptor-like protein A [Paramyrothecium foliicola]|nr:Cyclic AMP receptor-like protein A [Paramyrothecium foliicola]
MPVPRALTESQLDALMIIERVCSVLSLIGSTFVIGTFLLSKTFHKPINRLVFYASFGNMMSNVGTLMSRTYTDDSNSAGCQAQAFLIQWFMPADALWTLAMAINVYLTFYFKFDARRLRQMEIPYLFVCYGIPFIPALTYLFLKNGNGVRAYGNASLWCWIGREWSIWRIITFYAPVWLIVAMTFFIYLRAGHTIYRKRKELGDFRSSDQDPTLRSEVITTIKTTQVSVTVEPMNASDAMELRSMGGREVADSRSNGVYSVHISADANHNNDNADIVLPIQGQTTHASSVPGPSHNAADGPNAIRRRYRDINNAAWQYTKCAILFFTVMLITWIPSSANRVYSLTRADGSSGTLEFMSAFVLPLQGFWNAVIYMVTTWSATKNLINDLKMGRRPNVREFVGGMAPGIHNNPLHHSHHRHSQGPFRTGNRSHKTYETESMTELAESRPDS